MLSLSIQLKYNVVKASNFEYHRGAQFFQLFGSPRQNSSRQTGVTKQVPSQCPQIPGAGMYSLVALATWCPGFVHPGDSSEILKLSYKPIPRLTGVRFNAQR